MADVLILLMGHSLAMKIDLKSAFESKRKNHAKARSKRPLSIRVTEYKPDVE